MCLVDYQKRAAPGNFLKEGGCAALGNRVNQSNDHVAAIKELKIPGILRALFKYADDRTLRSRQSDSKFRQNPQRGKFFSRLVAQSP